MVNNWKELARCPKCGGFGGYISSIAGEAYSGEVEDCSRCKGTGRYVEKDKEQANVTQRDPTLSLRVP